MKILTYVLHGMWDTPDTDGVMVIGVSMDEKLLLRKLDEIADSKAKEYVVVRQIRCGLISQIKCGLILDFRNDPPHYLRAFRQII